MDPVLRLLRAMTHLNVGALLALGLWLLQHGGAR